MQKRSTKQDRSRQRGAALVSRAQRAPKTQRAIGPENIPSIHTKPAAIVVFNATR